MPRQPLDHPTPGRPHRIYVALTNHCNRSCPWCSTYSSPSGKSLLEPGALQMLLPETGSFQLQLEGGEPTIHPRFWEFVRMGREHPRCDHVIVCTNGVALPRQPERLRAWILRLGVPLTLKISVNHHLLDRDPGLIELCKQLRDVFAALGEDRLLIL